MDTDFGPVGVPIGDITRTDENARITLDRANQTSPRPRTMVFNIETVPDPDMPEEVMPLFPTAENVKAPSNWKDPEKIKQYVDEKVKDLSSSYQDELKEYGILPVSSKIVCISQCIDNRPVESIFGESEEELVKHFAEVVERSNIRQYVTFNGKSFDVPHLMIKFVQHRIHIPFGGMTKRYATYPHTDVYELLSFFGAHRKGNLTAWAQRFGLAEPYGKGSMVYEWWKAGDFDSISKHCASNVESTRQIYNHMLQFYPW